MVDRSALESQEIEITSEMLDAGAKVFEWWETDGSEEWDPRVLARAMYIAMLRFDSGLSVNKLFRPRAEGSTK